MTEGKRDGWVDKNRRGRTDNEYNSPVMPLQWIKGGSMAKCKDW